MAWTDVYSYLIFAFVTLYYGLIFFVAIALIEFIDRCWRFDWSLNAASFLQGGLLVVVLLLSVQLTLHLRYAIIGLVTPSLDEAPEAYTGIAISRKDHRELFGLMEEVAHQAPVLLPDQVRLTHRAQCYATELRWFGFSTRRRLVLVLGLPHVEVLSQGEFKVILAHELSHSLVARARGIPVDSITLFIFGGLAKIRRESDNARDEMLIAGVGPLTSVALAIMFMGVAQVVEGLGWGAAATTVALYLAVINAFLAGFNLLPGLPLDGGRLFRAMVWKATGDLTKATRWASAGGRWLGLGLMALGIVQALGGAALGGLWMVLIGWFIRVAADSTLQQHVLHDVLKGVTVGQIMSEAPTTVAPSLTVDELAHDYLLGNRYESYPVVSPSGAPLGLVTLEDVKRMPQESWALSRVSDIMNPLHGTLVIGENEPVSDALGVMQDTGRTRALVARDGVLVGIMSATDVARWARRATELGMRAPALQPVPDLRAS